MVRCVTIAYIRVKKGGCISYINFINEDSGCKGDLCWFSNRGNYVSS